MGNRNKFSEKAESRGLSFEDMMEQATTVANIEQQGEKVISQPAKITGKNKDEEVPTLPPAENVTPPVRYARLPNPQIPVTEVGLVEDYCRKFDNMTKQDFVELAIIEKLHNDCGMSQENFDVRYKEITSRLPRGHRKGTKTQLSK